MPNLHNFFSMQYHCRVFEDMGKHQLLNLKPQLALSAARSLFNTAVSISSISGTDIWAGGGAVRGKALFPFYF